jgi:tRNA-splicing ligase RtcB (3'-phosphate/5'-hydroxy nucleic acid ligase)
VAKEQHSHGDSSWVEGEDAKRYIDSMKVAQKFAEVNRNLMVAALLDIVSGVDDEISRVHSVHNYIDFSMDPPMIRKGAISAQAGQDLIIPLNMRDGIIVGRGLGNPEWNFSAPHGAGRKMSRSHAKASLDLSHFEKVMKGVWSSCISKDTLDESPMAYKDSQEILDLIIGQCVDTDYAVLKPVYNFKAGGE